MDSKTHRSLVEAAMEVRLGQIAEAEDPIVRSKETRAKEEAKMKKDQQRNIPIVSHVEHETEELVYEYLSSFFGVDLNESVDDLTEEQLEEAIIAINVLADAVNEYFEIDEAFDDDAARRRRENADIAALHKKGDNKGVARIMAARKAEKMPMGQAKKFVRRAVDNA